MIRTLNPVRQARRVVDHDGFMIKEYNYHVDKASEHTEKASEWYDKIEDRVEALRRLRDQSSDELTHVQQSLKKFESVTSTPQLETPDNKQKSRVAKSKGDGALAGAGA